jgi:hypothetical protein
MHGSNCGLFDHPSPLTSSASDEIRQRIEFGAHHNGGAIAIFVNRNQAGLADVLRHFEA